MPYAPEPLRPYTPKPLKPYLPAPLKPYLPLSPKPLVEKPDPKLIGWPLKESERETLKAIGEAGGAVTTLRLARTLGKGLQRTTIDCRVLAEADYVNIFASGLCRMRPLGWQELEKDGQRYPGAAYSYLDVSDVELQALRAIGEAGGATTVRAVAELLQLPLREALALCKDGLGVWDYVDVYSSGLIRMTRRGWQELEKADLDARRYQQAGISRGEQDVLKAIGEAGGESSVRAVAEALRMARREARIYCQALGQRDYLDLFVSGRCFMKKKGWQKLEEIQQAEGRASQEAQSAGWVSHAQYRSGVASP